MKPHGEGVATDATYRDSCRVNNDRVSLELEHQPPLTNNIQT